MTTAMTKMMATKATVRTSVENLRAVALDMPVLDSGRIEPRDRK
jgi:hypothetical protein